MLNLTTLTKSYKPCMLVRTPSQNSIEKILSEKLVEEPVHQNPVDVLVLDNDI